MRCHLCFCLPLHLLHMPCNVSTCYDQRSRDAQRLASPAPLVAHFSENFAAHAHSLSSIAHAFTGKLRRARSRARTVGTPYLRLRWLPPASALPLTYPPTRLPASCRRLPADASSLAASYSCISTTSQQTHDAPATTSVACCAAASVMPTIYSPLPVYYVLDVFLCYGIGCCGILVLPDSVLPSAWDVLVHRHVLIGVGWHLDSFLAGSLSHLPPGSFALPKLYFQHPHIFTPYTFIIIPLFFRFSRRGSTLPPGGTRTRAYRWFSQADRYYRPTPVLFPFTASAPPPTFPLYTLSLPLRMPSHFYPRLRFSYRTCAAGSSLFPSKLPHTGSRVIYSLLRDNSRYMVLRCSSYQNT